MADNIKGVVTMIKLIIGNKGSGKTKRLIDMVSTASETTKGVVICVEQGNTLTFSIPHKVRLIDSNAYGVSGYSEYFAFLSGVCACDHDVTDIFGDATLRIGGRDFAELSAFLDRVSELSKESNINFTFTISCDENELPAKIFEYAEKI